jgi:hypothetical protein
MNRTVTQRTLYGRVDYGISLLVPEDNRNGLGRRPNSTKSGACRAIRAVNVTQPRIHKPF